MKFSLPGIACTIVLWLLYINNAVAQSPSYHTLTADEFEGIPPANSGLIAYTNCSVDFHYHVTGEKNYYRLGYNIRLIFNRDKSWIDRKKIRSSETMDEVLKHEQGHYTIAYMEQQELIRTVARTRFGADYQQMAGNIFDRIDAKYKQLTLDYDEDTGHMINRVQQHSWDLYFKKRLTYMPPSQ
jgi:hypothetical protein